MELAIQRTDTTAAPAAIATFGAGSLLGILPELKRDPIDVLRQTLKHPEDLVRFHMGPRSAILLKHPDHIEHVLVGHAKQYSKGIRNYQMLKLVLGNGLVTSEGASWFRQRRLAQPAFHRARLAAFATTMVEATEGLLDSWRPAINGRTPVDVAEEMTRLTAKIVCRTLLGTDSIKGLDDVNATVTALSRFVDHRADTFIATPLAIPTPANIRFKRERAKLDRAVFGIIQERRAAGPETEHDDLLGMFMRAKDVDTGESMNDQQLRDEVMTMFLAGHETTATALAWTFYLLSMNPAVQARLRAELERALGGARAPTLEDLKKVPLLERVIREAMRLYPPVWMIGRLAEEDDAIGGVRIEKGEWIFVSPFVTHRHPSFWDNPEGFDPDRFLPERSQGRPRYAFCPFGGGQRQCIGDNFAMMEAQLVLATIASRVRLDLAPWQKVDIEPIITLRPRHGMHMTVSAVSTRVPAES